MSGPQVRPGLHVSQENSHTGKTGRRSPLCPAETSFCAERTALSVPEMFFHAKPFHTDTVTVFLVIVIGRPGMSHLSAKGSYKDFKGTFCYSRTNKAQRLVPAP